MAESNPSLYNFLQPAPVLFLSTGRDAADEMCESRGNDPGLNDWEKLVIPFSDTSRVAASL